MHLGGICGTFLQLIYIGCPIFSSNTKTNSLLPYNCLKIILVFSTGIRLSRICIVLDGAASGGRRAPVAADRMRY